MHVGGFESPRSATPLRCAGRDRGGGRNSPEEMCLNGGQQNDGAKIFWPQA